MRFGQAALGALLVVVGVIWAGQGANLIPGSFMTGDRRWLVTGIAAAVAGLALLLRAGAGRR